MSEIPKVALLIETARGYGREVLRGVVGYARLHGPWAFYVTPGDFAQALPKMEQWGGTGIIARVENAEIGRAILAAELPAVALDLTDEQRAGGHPLARLAHMTSDSRGAARMAAAHLLDKGFRHYAFVGLWGRVWSSRRQAGFTERIAEAGLPCDVYPVPRSRRDREWGREQAIMAQWLADLPKPIGIMACNDDRGREVLEACRAAGVHVPEEVAVVGVDNDELLCELADPPLSSVALNGERGGFEAAALLDQMMKAREGSRAGWRKLAAKVPPIVVEPLHVVTRRSTDVVALDDHDVAAALHFIHQRAAQPIGVMDVVAEVGLSRRALEIRFQKALGRSLNQEIQRDRLERAKRLLLETDLPLPRVAAAAGYGSPSYLAEVVHKQLGTTPMKYRAKLRGR